MSRGAQRFRQSDVIKTIRGAQKAGLQVRSVELDLATGKLVVIMGSSHQPDTGDIGTHIDAEVKRWEVVK